MPVIADFQRQLSHHGCQGQGENVQQLFHKPDFYVKTFSFFKHEQILLEMIFDCAGPPQPSCGPSPAPRPSFGFKALVCVGRGGKGGTGRPRVRIPRGKPFSERETHPNSRKEARAPGRKPCRPHSVQGAARAPSYT